MNIIDHLLIKLGFRSPETPWPIAAVPNPDPGTTFLDVVVSELRGYTPVSVIVTETALRDQHIPTHFVDREVPWQELRPHLSFPFEYGANHRTFPKMRIFTKQGRDVLIDWSDEQGRFLCVTFERAKSRGYDDCPT